MKVKITVDSTADLSAELYEKYNIGMVSLTVGLGDDIYLDGQTINPDMIYEYVKNTKKLPKTSAVNSEQYKEQFEKYFAEGYDAIIHFNLSSEMSTSYANAKMLTEEMKNLYVIDSRNLSTATALLAIYASELAKEEKFTAEQIAELVEKRVPYTEASFVLDNLEYLYRGGRCNAVALFGANLLKIKPSIEVNGGKMGVAKKYLGNYSKCVMKYVKDTLEKYNTPDTKRIFITHTKIEQEIVDEVKKYLEENTKFEEIYITAAGSTITSHCGPHTLGILFMNDGDKI